MSAEFSWLGFDALSRKLARLADPDATPLMEQWEKVLVEDNRRGVLAGVDKDDAPMPPLKYRGGAGKPTKSRGKNRGTVPVGAFNGGPGGNLSNSQYRKLTGPRLAPRGVNSRVITNYKTGHGRDPADRFRWIAAGRWFDVVSKAGVHFLPFHFEGKGRLPRYDLAGLRQWGQTQARLALKRWVDTLLRAV